MATRNKFHAKKTEAFGILFDSKAEAKRYGELVIQQRAGIISGLTLQVPFELAPSVKFAGAPRAKPAIRYMADFMYSDIKTGNIVVEDVKGMVTPVFRIKQHLMKSVHGIDVRLSK